MRQRCAILDDYLNVSTKLADWSRLAKKIDITVFNKPFANQSDVIMALQGFQIVGIIRERTPFPRSMFEALPDLKLLVTTGWRNGAVDIAAAKDHGVTFCGTDVSGMPTAGLTIGLILELTRHIGSENARLHAGSPWQSQIGQDVEGQTLGLLGLGRLGARVANIARELGMKTIAWSQNLTRERCAEVGVTYASREELFSQADIVSIHVVLGQRNRGLVGRDDIARMKKTAYLINTSRGPIVDEQALLDALRERRIAGAGLDVFWTEPLPLDHPLRSMDNVVITPHLGYATTDNHQRGFVGMVEDIESWLDGKPIRLID
jgi:D-3-phosphoglycerate dehydrogenase